MVGVHIGFTVERIFFVLCLCSPAAYKLQGYAHGKNAAYLNDATASVVACWLVVVKLLVVVVSAPFPRCGLALGNTEVSLSRGAVWRS